MGTMNSMRENTGVVLWILVFAFGVIWVLQDSGGLDTIGQQGNELITVDGDPITVEEYNQAVQSAIQRVQQRTGQALTPQQRDMYRERVFDMLVESRLRQQAMDRLGITVTDDELYNMVMGENPHPIIRQQFSNEQGQVDRALLQSFIDNPETQQQWIQLENYLRRQRRSEKLNQLVNATVHVSEQDVLNTYQRRNTKVDAQYAALRYAEIPNDSAQVTESDLEDFYEQHREDFKRKESYTINYATLPKSATAQDTAAVREELERLQPEFAAAENDSLFLEDNASQEQYRGTYVTRNEMEEPVAEAVFNNLEPGTVVGPIAAAGQMHLVKIQDVRPAEEPAVRARHILLRAPEGNTEQRQEARQQAQDLKNQLQQGEASFAELARAESDDATASQGGDLGWFSEGQMVPSFEEAAFNADVGEVVGPVETRFGYHLIKVTGRANQEVKLANYAMNIRPDPATLRELETKLEDLSYYASESGNFTEEAERLGLNVQQMQIEKGQETLPGLGRSSRIQDFLETSEPGDVSDVIELDDQYFVAEIASTQEAGYRPLSEVRGQLEPRVRLEKKKAIQKQRLQQALQQYGFEGLGQVPGLQKRTAEDLTMANPVVPGLGRSPKFVGTAMGLDAGQVSGVVAGENAAFVLKVNNIQEPPALTETQRQQLRQQLARQRQQELQNEWIAGLREDAEIVDNRARFRR